MQFDFSPTAMLYALSLLCALYVIGACLCRIRHRSSEIKHSWKIIYVIMLGLSGWALCDLLSLEYMLFQQAVCASVALYVHMTKAAWLSGPPDIAKTNANGGVQAYTYEQARSQIKTGDMVGMHTGTLGGSIIQAGQSIAGLPYSHITHCAIAVWRENRLMVAEMGPSGNTLKYMSQYASKQMVVCEPCNEADISRFEPALDHVLEHHIPYSAGDLARIGLRLLPMRLLDTRRLGGDGDATKVCSLFPSMLYSRMGGDVSAIPPLAAPAEVVQALTVRFEIMGA